MDGKQFDTLARSLIRETNRRRTLLVALGGALTLGRALNLDDVDAAHSNKCRPACADCQFCKVGRCRKKRNGDRSCKLGKCKVKADGAPCTLTGGFCQAGTCTCGAGTEACGGACVATCAAGTQARNRATCACCAVFGQFCPNPTATPLPNPLCCSGVCLPVNPPAGIGLCAPGTPGTPCSVGGNCGSGSCTNGVCD
jgi:hypothetical protein